MTLSRWPCLLHPSCISQNQRGRKRTKRAGKFPRGCGLPVTHHAWFISWAKGGLQWAHKWTDSSCHGRPCMLTSELTVNMLLYNVKRACLVLYPWHDITLHQKCRINLFSHNLWTRNKGLFELPTSLMFVNLMTWFLWLVTVPVPNPAQQGVTWVAHRVLYWFARHNIF